MLYWNLDKSLSRDFRNLVARLKLGFLGTSLFCAAYNFNNFYFIVSSILGEIGTSVSSMPTLGFLWPRIRIAGDFDFFMFDNIPLAIVYEILESFIISLASYFWQGLISLSLSSSSEEQLAFFYPFSFRMYILGLWWEFINVVLLLLRTGVEEIKEVFKLSLSSKTFF